MSIWTASLILTTALVMVLPAVLFLGLCRRVFDRTGDLAVLEHAKAAFRWYRPEALNSKLADHSLEGRASHAYTIWNMPSYDAVMIGGPWNGQFRSLTAEALAAGSFGPDDFEGSYTRDIDNPKDWHWIPDALTITASGPTREEARANADKEALKRYGCKVSGEVSHETKGGQLDAAGNVIGEPITWTVQVRYS